jgi:chorismate-pyruvate lyase
MQWSSKTLCLCVGSALLPALACQAQQLPPAASESPGTFPGWHDGFTARLEALALLQTLNADLLSHDSATLTLDRWCAAHRMASPPQIVADRLPQSHKPPSARQRQELEVTPTEVVRYRQVRLRCGGHVLSVAENWYVPDRLTADMNRTLESTDIPFGRVVQPLRFSRHTLQATLVWSPLPAHWESARRVAPTPWPTPEATLIRHRAILTLPDGRPISEVVENYTAEVLAFPQPEIR